MIELLWKKVADHQEHLVFIQKEKSAVQKKIDKAIKDALLKIQNK
jgi:hypothetical protein